MASVQYFFNETPTIVNELIEKQILLNKLTTFRQCCALVIQKTWRGYRARLNYVNICAKLITIQSYCRGWLVRKRREQYKQQHESDMYWLNMSKKATRIQACWRGYALRKLMKGRLPCDLIKERARIAEVNAKMREYMRYQFKKSEQLNEVKEAENKSLVMYILFKCHHLLRTHQQEGIYSIHASTQLSVIEQLIKALPLKEYMREVRNVYYELMKMGEAPAKYFFKDENLRKYEDLWRRSKATNEAAKEERIEVDRYERKELHKKEFIRTAKIERRYEREMFTQGKYEDEDEIKQKAHQRSDKQFILDKRMDLRDRRIPYHIDFWEKHCGGGKRNDDADEC